MAIYKLIPSSFTTSSSSSTLYNASNAYTDTDSDTAASLSLNYANARGWLGGFNFPTLESGERIVSITAKVKTYNSILDYGEMRIVSNATTSNVVLSSSINSDDCGAYPAKVYTMEWVEDLDTVYSYRDTICVEFKQNTTYKSGAFTVYGAEIIVKTAKIERNKIIYGGETLIDLTSDTVTAADVTSGVVFHLPSGVQAIGTMSNTPKSATGVRDSRTQLHFTIENEPTWFLCYQWADTNSSSAVGDIMIEFDGTSLAATRVSTSSSSTYVYMSRLGDYESSFSFTYSSGTLTITAPSHTSGTIFGTGPWKLYYV